MWSFCIQSTFCYYGSHLGSHFHCTISTHYRFITWIRLPFYPLFFFSLVLILCNVYLIKTLTTKYIANIFIIVYFCWIPRNIGIHGNSQAEKAAKNLLPIWYCSKHTCTNRNIIVVHASYGYSLMLSSFL